MIPFTRCSYVFKIASAFYIGFAREHFQRRFFISNFSAASTLPASCQFSGTSTDGASCNARNMYPLPLKRQELCC